MWPHRMRAIKCVPKQWWRGRNTFLLFSCFIFETNIKQSWISWFCLLYDTRKSTCGRTILIKRRWFQIIYCTGIVFISFYPLLPFAYEGVNIIIAIYIKYRVVFHSSTCKTIINLFYVLDFCIYVTYKLRTKRKLQLSTPVILLPDYLLFLFGFNWTQLLWSDYILMFSHL